MTPSLPIRYESLLVETAEVVVLPAIAFQSVEVLPSGTWETGEIHIVSQVVKLDPGGEWTGAHSRDVALTVRRGVMIEQTESIRKPSHALLRQRGANLLSEQV